MNKIVPDSAVLVPDEASKVFDGLRFDIYQWPQKLFDGSETTFEMLKRTDTVSAICIVDDQVIVIDDEQPHNGTYKSFPGGHVELTDISVEEAAKREIKEETGYEFKNWKLVKVTQPTIEMEWFVYVYIAWDVESKSELSLDAGEKIEVNLMSFDDAKQLILSGVGHLIHNKDIFEEVDNTTGLIESEVYQGTTVNR